MPLRGQAAGKTFRIAPARLPPRVDALPKVGQFCSLKSRPLGGLIVCMARGGEILDTCRQGRNRVEYFPRIKDSFGVKKLFDSPLEAPLRLAQFLL